MATSYSVPQLGHAKGTEIMRTCNRDGAVWYVPTDKRKVSLAKRIFLPRFMVKRRKAEILSFARCPRCGSSSFTERVVEV